MTPPKLGAVREDSLAVQTFALPYQFPPDGIGHPGSRIWLYVNWRAGTPAFTMRNRPAGEEHGFARAIRSRNGGRHGAPGSIVEDRLARAIAGVLSAIGRSV